MSPDTTVPTQEELHNFSWLLEGWVYSLISAIKGMGCPAPSFDVLGETVAIAVPAAPRLSVDEEQVESGPAEGEAEPAVAPPPAADDVLWWGQSFNIHASHCVWSGAAADVRRRIGRDALVAAGIDEPEDADIESTYQELVVQSMSGLATRLTARCGREVTGLSGLFVPRLDAGLRRDIALQIAEDVTITITFAASMEFLQQLMRAGFHRQTGWIARDQRSGDRRGKDARATRETKEEKAVAPSEPDMIPFDSVLDMDIPVSISFGTARLRLDEALLLKEGSLVVLNRTIDDPVELQVNGRVVARGEVIAVRGQYGIRIHELASESDRMEYIDPAHRPEIEASLNS